MTTKRYFIKEKCNYCEETGQINIITEPYKEDCILCKTKGFVKGADITEYITGLLDEIDTTQLDNSDRKSLHKILWNKGFFRNRRRYVFFR